MSNQHQRSSRPASRQFSGSLERFVPLTLGFLGLVTLVLILIAAGVLIGFIRF